MQKDRLWKPRHACSACVLQDGQQTSCSHSRAFTCFCVAAKRPLFCAAALRSIS